MNQLLRLAGLSGVLLVSLSPLPYLHAQFGAPQKPQVGTSQGPPDASGHRSDDENDPQRKAMLARLEAKRNEARQQQLVKDTTKLLALASELKVDVDRTSKDMLSIDVIKKADEIEKLAKSVKEKMKQ